MIFEPDQFVILKDNNQKKYYNSNNNSMPTIESPRYLESDDDETLTTAIDDFSSLDLCPSLHNMQAFQEELEDPSDARIIQCQNTYFMDGGSRFISLPSLGNSNTKLTLPLSRVFEEWLANKLYYYSDDDNNESNSNINIPILEESVELLAEDIMNQFKMKNIHFFLKGSKILVKLRADHIYTYHQLNGQPLITQDMEDFFQQFPLFVEIIIHVIPHLGHETELLLTVQNATSYEPYFIMETI